MRLNSKSILTGSIGGRKNSSDMFCRSTKKLSWNIVERSATQVQRYLNRHIMMTDNGIDIERTFNTVFDSVVKKICFINFISSGVGTRNS